MDNNNISKFILSSNKYVTNINRALKNIKSEIMADFVHTDHCGLIIITNKVASQSDLSTIENYIKNIDVIESEDIITPHLPQSKSYLKIISTPYNLEGINIPINSSIIETIIKSIHIFNNVCLTSKPHIIKVLSKSDMMIIWVNI